MAYRCKRYRIVHPCGESQPPETNVMQDSQQTTLKDQNHSNTAGRRIEPHEGSRNPSKFGCSAERSTYEVKTSSKSVNYVEFRRSSDAIRYHGTRKEKVLVVAHGFGLGLGFFFDNYDHLLDHFDRIIAVDWLGMGCSGRTAKEVTLIAQGVHNELVDSLESLCHEENISDFVLAGHSLGGYLAAKYAVRYPNRVQSLILISPAGIGSRPKESDQAIFQEVEFYGTRVTIKVSIPHFCSPG
eukprot:gene29512-38616_t